MSLSGPSAPTSGERTASTSRPCRAASIRTTARSSRPAASMSIWWPPLRCPLTRWRSTSEPAPACSPPFSPAAASTAWWRPTMNPARSPAPAENFRNLGVQDRAEAVLADMFPPGRAPLIVCNPPWIPATPHSSLDNAVYDPGSRMLFRFLNELSGHLEPGGEGWLVLSDLAEHLGLRTRDRAAGRHRGGRAEGAGTARHQANPPQGIRPQRSLVRGPGGRGHLAVAARRPLVSALRRPHQCRSQTLT